MEINLRLVSLYYNSSLKRCGFVIVSSGKRKHIQLTKRSRERTQPGNQAKAWWCRFRTVQGRPDSASLTTNLSCDLPLASTGSPPAALLWHPWWFAIYLLVDWAGSQRCFFPFSHISRIREGFFFPSYIFSHKNAKYSPPTVNKFNLAVFTSLSLPSAKSLQFRDRCVSWEIFQVSLLLLLLLLYLMPSHSTIHRISTRKALVLMNTPLLHWR